MSKIQVKRAASSVWTAKNPVLAAGEFGFATEGILKIGDGAQSWNALAAVGGLTTAAQSDHSHGNPTLALTNLSGTTASASNGLTLSLSAAAPGAGGGFAAQGSGAYTQNTGTIQFANSNGITFGLSTNQMTASHNGLTTAAQSNHSHGNPTLALTNISGTTASASNGLTLSLSAAAPGGGGGAGTGTALNLTNLTGTLNVNTDGVSLSLSAGAGGGAVPNRSYIEIMNGERLTTIAQMSASQFSRRPIFQPFWLDGAGLIPKTINIMGSFVTATNKSIVATVNFGVYSLVNSTQISLLDSASLAWSYTSNQLNGIRAIQLTGLTATMPEGRWMLALNFSASSHNTNYFDWRVYGGDNFPNWGGWVLGGTSTGATNNTSQFFPFWGVYSTTTGGLPGSVHITQINGGRSADLLDIYAVLREL